MTLPARNPLHRRRVLTAGGASALATLAFGRVAAAAATTRERVPLATLDPARLRAATLGFVASLRMADGPYGRYRYAAGSTEHTLYSSTYAAMTRDLYGDLATLSTAEREAWIAYLQSHQDDDGLFRDPVIFDQGWYAGDPEWCGRRHLSCHVVTALTSLGAVAGKPLRCLDPFLAPGGLVAWLESRDWQARPDFVGNEVLNVGTLLQYARDFQRHPRAGDAVATMLRWMTDHHLNPATGLWGGLDTTRPRERSRAVQAGYHFWLLWFYDRVAIPHAERAIDACLATQNACGGFGLGVHTGSDRESSACEDIDSIDPLARLLAHEPPHRRDDIRTALARGAEVVLAAQAADGGFQFVRGRPFEYGHPQLAAGETEGAMFPTWFRTLTLAYLGRALPASPLGAIPWRFCNCPGIQFWLDPRP
jgi:alkylhydroperoxidase family enzyme